MKKLLGRFDLFLVVLMIFGTAMIFASAAWSQATTCDELGFDFGCKVDPPIDGVYDCAAREVDAKFSGEGPKTLDWLGGAFDGVFIKGGPTYAEYLYDPPSNGDTGLIAPQNKDISHVLFCYDSTPPPPVGSCCVDCIEDSGEDDKCLDEKTLDECDELNGRWLAEVSCEQRDDCDDFCPPFEPVGASCLENGDCVEDVTESACEELGCLNWEEGASCEDLECGDPETGACCAGYGDCINETTEEQCAGTGEGWIWYGDTDCEDVVCETPVPTMNQWFLIVLGVVLAIAGVFGVRRFVHRFERMGPFR